MITIDTESLDKYKGESYAEWRGDRGGVLLDGKPLKHVIYANIDYGFAIKHKCDLSGSPIISLCEFVHEIVFGKLEFKPHTAN